MVLKSALSNYSIHVVLKIKNGDTGLFLSALGKISTEDGVYNVYRAKMVYGYVFLQEPAIKPGW
jgi:hypothetical protein